ncbi:MAG: MBL fold metallo-hydrolase [Deltaproteobacteria bacterium]|nr:MBL fold metallo-hydrolase [Deltaproteobacteria bacterium]
MINKTMSSALALLTMVTTVGCASGEKVTPTPVAAVPDGPPPGIGRRDDAAVLGPYGKGPLVLLAHQSAEYSAKVNSWLIEGPTEIGLVDAQLIVPEGVKVAELIKSRKKKLAWVWITHAHPDHYAGLEAIAKAFPGTPMLARAAVVDEGPAFLKKFDGPLQKFFPGEMTTAPVALTASADKVLKVDGHEILVEDIVGGEHTSSTTLAIPSLKALLVADLVYNRVHPWTNELDTDGIFRHLDALAARHDIETFYPGHGEPFGHEGLAPYRQYVVDFLADAKVATDTNDLVLRTWRRHPDWRTMAGLRFSAAAHIEARAAAPK